MEENNIEISQTKENVLESKFQITKKHFILFGIFFIFFNSLLLITGIAGDDYWWHVKVGEWIIENGEVPKTGIYSWYAQENNLSWFAHEWLAEIVLYLFTMLFGRNGGIIYLFCTITLVSVLLYCYNYKGYMKNLAFSSLWAFIGFLAIGTISTARPHMLTISLFTILIHICEQIKKNENYKLYLLFPLISLFWANYHGGSSNLVYIIPIIYFVTNSFSFNYGKLESIKTRKTYRYLILALTNAIAIFFNPRTYQLYYYPYSYTEEHAKYISEWQSPSLTNGGGFAIAFIILICLIFFFTKIKINFSDLAIVGCFMLLTLKSIRFDAWLYIVATMVIFKYIREIQDKSIYKWLAYEFAILGIAFLCYFGYCYYKGDTYIKQNVPNEVIDILKTDDYDKLLNYYDYGSYLIYEEIDTFIDGRADMYSGYNFKQEVEGNRFTYDYTSKQFIEEFNFDMFLVPAKSYMSYYLESNTDLYENLFKDDTIVLYKLKTENIE